MEHALLQARRALERQEFPVGCVIVAGDELLAEGCRENSGGRTDGAGNVNELDHAEILALRRFRHTLSQGKRRCEAAITVYSTLEPCLMCYATLLVNGLHRIVYAYEDAMGGGTNLPLASLNPLYRDLGVEIVAGVMRQESLALFQQFFTQDTNRYLQGSLLARYTLAQPHSGEETT